MTKQECAIVTAYTEISMLRGDDLKYLYRYLSEIIGRPVFTHEIPAVCEQFRDRIKADFIALCRNASDDAGRCDSMFPTSVSGTEGEKMQLIDRHALLKNVYDNPPEKARMTHAEWYRKCIYEAPTIEARPVRHGRWIPTEYDSYADGAPVWDKWECSECGHEHSVEKDTLTAFCPDCGAKMYADGGTISRERFAEIMGEDKRP